MKYENIETFLAIVENGTIVQAARQVNITQATASIRIKQLEEDLGISLFYRNKGQKKTSLTSHGERFLPIAQLWVALWNDAMNLKNMQIIQNINIAAPETLNVSTFLEIYNEIIDKYPNVNLSVKSYHSKEVHRLIENQLCDIGLCTNLYHHQNINAIALYEERMVIVYHKSHPFHASKDFKDFHYGLEIYVHYSSAFDTWHKQFFIDYEHKTFSVGTVSMQTQYLTNDQTWAITPYNLAYIFTQNNPDFVIHELEAEPPKRMIYLLSYKYPKPDTKKNISLFLQIVFNKLKNNPTITPIINKHTVEETILK